MKRIDVCVGTDRGRNVRIRLSLLVVDDATGEILAEKYHSVVAEPDADLAGIRESIEAHLALPGGGVPGAPWPKIPDVEWQEVVDVCAILHTPERKAQAAAKRANNRADNE